MYDTAARSYSVFYNISYDVEDDPEAAMESLELLLDCGMKAGSPQLRLYALLGRLDIAAEAGDYDEVERVVRTLTAHEVDLSDSNVSEALLPAQALQLASQGDFEEAHRLLAASGARQITPDRRALRFSEIALYAAAGRQLGVAHAALAELVPALDELEPKARRTVRTRLNCALALYLVGETAQAYATLETAILSTPGRLDAFRGAVETIFRRWDGDRNSAAVARAFDTLRDRYFGGLADVLAALPSAPPKQTAFTRVP
jgi:tetratricopeptide (TPR) repeat protein